MATCIVFETTSGPTNRGSPSLSTIAAWKVGEGSLADGKWTCPAGSHLVLTIEEVNTPPEFVLDLPALGITPEKILIVASLGAAMVLASFMSGWGVGLAKDLIKKF